MFKCDKCEKTFTNKRNRNIHISKKICEKTSVIKIINNKKRYECLYCETNYSKNSYLQNHVKNMHSENILSNKFKKELKEVKKELKEVKAELKKVKEELGNSTINNSSQINIEGNYINSINNTNNINNVVIQVNAFDKTSFDHLII